MRVGDTDVSECEYLKVKPITLNWGIGKEYTTEYRCKKYNDLSCELFGECEYKRCKRLNDFIKETEAKAHELNYLSISYKDFNNIETILTDWFNDYPIME